MSVVVSEKEVIVLDGPQRAVIDQVEKALIEHETRTGRRPDVVYIGMNEWTTLSTHVPVLGEMRILDVEVRVLAFESFVGVGRLQ